MTKETMSMAELFTVELTRLPFKVLRTHMNRELNKIQTRALRLAMQRQVVKEEVIDVTSVDDVEDPDEDYEDDDEVFDDVVAKSAREKEDWASRGDVYG